MKDEEFQWSGGTFLRAFHSNPLKFRDLSWDLRHRYSPNKPGASPAFVFRSISRW